MLIGVEIATLINEREAKIIDSWKGSEEGKAFFRGKDKICRNATIIESARSNDIFSYRLLVLEFRFVDYKDDEDWYLGNIRKVTNDIEKLIQPDRTESPVIWKVYQMRYKLGLIAAPEYYDLFSKGFRLTKEKMVYVRNDKYIEYINDSTRLIIYRNPYIGNEKTQLIYKTHKGDHPFQLELILKRDRILWFIKKFGFMDRSPKGILKCSYIKAIELFMYHIYLKGILGTGRFWPIDTIITMVEKSGLSQEKVRVLQNMVKEIDEMGGAEVYMQAVDNGKSKTASKRNTAMGYFRQLNALNINPIACQDPLGLDNIVVELPEEIKVNIFDGKIFYRQFKFIEWYKKTYHKI